MKVLAGNQLRNVTFENGKYRMSYFALNHHSLADGAVVTSFELGRISALRVIAEIEGRDDPYPEGDDEQDGAGEES